jgi:DNA helicase-2/ATP-dependent DNA helicase PcrA
MNNLFETSEAAAARLLFYFVAGKGRHRPETPLSEVEDAWLAADLGIDLKDLRHALKQVEKSKHELGSSEERRWGVYSIQRVYLSFLEGCRLREERIPAGRGEVVFYNLGKFSQLISDFEQIHFHSKPTDKYASFADFLQFQAD